ncbi:SCP2 sterol-binding domain-containing protein [Trinickia sp. LjRoot230]|uniref:ubiquinone biosynthesis accessory factor UbiJ n=1 Tax=Trinickia sp. LjRoot230 TaxID=3342288 RepID=UPI003ECC88CC
MILAAKPLATAVNHLLARETWARERLAPYAGKTAKLAFSSLAFTLVVLPEGYLSAVDEIEVPCADVSISVPAEALAAFMQGGQAAVMKHVKIDGDAEFATLLGKLTEHLRWEPEEDLARLLGDAPAHRVTALVHTVGAHVARTGRNVRDSVAEYLLDENPQLVRRTSLELFNTELARARDALARIEKRVERLEARGARVAAAPRGTR